jgi:hypothetical protein
MRRMSVWILLIFMASLPASPVISGPEHNQDPLAWVSRATNGRHVSLDAAPADAAIADAAAQARRSQEWRSGVRWLKLLGPVPRVIPGAA